MTGASVPFSLINLVRFAVGEAVGNKCSYEVTEMKVTDAVG